MAFPHLRQWCCKESHFHNEFEKEMISCKKILELSLACRNPICFWSYMDFRFQKKGLYQWYSIWYSVSFNLPRIVHHKSNDLNFLSFANYQKVKVLTYCTTGSCHIQPSLESRVWAYLHYSHLKRLNIHKLCILYIWISNLILICPTCPTLASPCSNRQVLSPLLCWVGENAAHCRPRLSPAIMTSFWWRKCKKMFFTKVIYSTLLLCPCSSYTVPRLPPMSQTKTEQSKLPE